MDYSFPIWCLLMSYRDYIRKFKILLEEAEKDFINGCYNKTVSSLWFSIEALIRAILIRTQGWVPERTGKLISVFGVFLKRKFPSEIYLIKDLSRLYVHRSNVDHGRKVYDKKTVQSLYIRAKNIISKLRNIAQRLNVQI